MSRPAGCKCPATAAFPCGRFFAYKKTARYCYYCGHVRACHAKKKAKGKRK